MYHLWVKKGKNSEYNTPCLKGKASVSGKLKKHAPLNCKAHDREV